MECDLWEGRLNDAGYGVLDIDGKEHRAHRIVWMQDNGHTDLLILHTCDVRACIEITHLYASTHKQNMLDMMSRGRHSNGSAEKTHCKQGHVFDQDNTYYRPDGDGRQCLKCKTIRRNR